MGKLKSFLQLPECCDVLPYFATGPAEANGELKGGDVLIAVGDVLCVGMAVAQVSTRKPVEWPRV